MSLHTVRLRLRASAALLLLAVSSGGFTAEPDSVLAPRDALLLSPVRLPSARGQFKVVIVDTVQLLNKSKWREDKDPLPLTPRAALDLAIASIPSGIRSQTEKGLTSISLKPFQKPTVSGVWYYDIEFRPLSQSGGGYDNGFMHVAIVLMDGTTLVPKTIRAEDLPKGQWCTYSKKDVWQRTGCK